MSELTTIPVTGIPGNAQDGECIEVHNVWTVYDGTADGSMHEEPICCMSRPQDWGHPKWHYDLVRFEATIEGKTYVNHCHCWTDMHLDTPIAYLQMFSELIVSISLPGTPVQLCGRDYLAEDDFWQEDWGPLPKMWDPDNEENMEIYIVSWLEWGEMVHDNIEAGSADEALAIARAAHPDGSAFAAMEQA